jgi:hypothetical protein
LRAVRLTLSLSPVPQEVVDIALAERSFRLRPARLWGVLLDAEGAFVADPFPLWAGLMDVMEVTDGAEARIGTRPWMNARPAIAHRSFCPTRA